MQKNDKITLPPPPPPPPILLSVPFNWTQLNARVLNDPGVRPSPADRIVTGIGPSNSIYFPMIEQRLIANWKEHLEWQPTLDICTTQNRISFAHTIIINLTTLVFDLLHDDDIPNPNLIKSMLLDFLSRTPPRDQPSHAYAHLWSFTNSAAPQLLVMLYTHHTHSANHAIREFILHSSNYEDRSPNYKHTLALEFSKWLRWAAGIYDPLYLFCRDHLLNDKDDDSKEKKNALLELATRLLHDLELSKEQKSSSSYYVGPALRDVKDLAAFLVLLNNEIMAVHGRPVDQNTLPLSSYVQEVTCLRRIFFDLLHRLDECLVILEEEEERVDGQIRGCRHYLAILTELHTISKLYEGAEEVFWETIKQRKVALCYLIVRFVESTDDHKWILEAKEVTNSESRRHLAMRMFPRDEGSKYAEMFIDRSRLFAESFECIARADPGSLRALLGIQFKNEWAMGDGVIREWFYLLCQEIFNPQNTLFMACPNDRRRFFPNPGSKVDPLHLEYFGFSGRVIALAMMHGVQVGIAFDRVFSLQLAGYSISIEDIRDADPYLYSSCKKILEMDPEAVDQDVLGLTFVHEVEEFGKRKVVELCIDGRSMVVNSKNRKQYVDSLIQHRFVTAVGEQIAHFAQGFADIISCGSLQRSFFQFLEPEDLDRMLYGSKSAISVDDWKAHTKYDGGFEETDPQISWFWKVVECMSTEQKRALLFFWTSIRYLPPEGFKNLSLCIYKTSESSNHLPSSRTCFHLLCLPAYPSQAMLRDRLQIITQEHVIFSFGDVH